MITVSGIPFQQSGQLPLSSIERVIIQGMQNDSVVYSFQSIDELSFELKLRKNIVESAREMDQGDSHFEPFEESYCNPGYWNLTIAGGFQLKKGVKPSEAILDIYRNSSLYAFECATAMIIIYYHATLKSIGENVFNQLFQNIYLYSWHFDPDLGIHTIHTEQFLPGDVVYFNNPDVDPDTSWWRGENAVVLEDGTFFGHGLGIRTAWHMIQLLNEKRKQGSIRSAFLTNSVTRPTFKHLAHITHIPQRAPVHKLQYIVIHHNESSISCSRYLKYLMTYR
ncbi:protein-glutamine gamma-glutamyltransferase [Lederbergia citri]|uniref:Protein-glutamine gamma-glutamyltransferase n=1 Tax=Lederbergia citri TaxID=2833580 RepID=A0A942TGA5_9BACI|nr:protein-glutamine gamma-glutamyltransferase [Lederbergia citri]MBS4197501.1 protein-glutamine gamma-glutamyltransferase [Lederbergia citri]